MKIILLDKKEECIQHLCKLFSSSKNVTCVADDINNIQLSNSVFVSPANSLLFMDGGIDFVYSRKMFPGVEKKVRQRLVELNIKTSLGRNYLPIGSALIVKAAPQSWLISAPTMFLPHDVSKTRNSYYAFMSSLCLFKKFKSVVPSIETLVCPSLCTGWGRMTYEEAAKQMYEAFVDFSNGNTPNDYEMSFDVFKSENRDNEQPNHYDNREIKNIDIKDIIFNK